MVLLTPTTTVLLSEIDSLSSKLQQAASSCTVKNDVTDDTSKTLRIATAAVTSSHTHTIGSDRTSEVDDKPTAARQATNALSDRLVTQLRDTKQRYRERFERFQELKGEAVYLAKVRDQTLTQLTREFESWKQQFVRQCERLQEQQRV